MLRLLLIIDDDPLSAHLAAQSLKPLALRTVIANSARQTYQLASASPPALAIVDMGLPDGPGADLCQWLRQRIPDAGILCLSGYVAESDRAAALAHGADAYLCKPVAPPALLGQARAVLLARGWRPVHRAPPPPSSPRFDATASQLTLPSGDQVHLSPTESRILAALLRQGGASLALTDLAAWIWGPTTDPAMALLALDAHLRRLRLRIEPDPQHPRYLHYVPGQSIRCDLLTLIDR